MAKTKVSEWDAVPGNNTDIDSINIAEGCAPSGINNAIRELMSQVKDFQQGTYSDPFNGPVNGTIGATTPAAGAFTTLSASGAVTLSGGTANGVAYLNGSKVLTSGSALTFDGTNLNVVRSAAADQYISLYADSVGPTVKLFGGASGKTASIVADSNASSMFFMNEGNKPFIYSLNGSEAMRLTSTGLGIGTSSPTNALSVSGNANITGNTTLGDASTDTVTVNGYMGVGGAPNSAMGVHVQNSALSGVANDGVRVSITGTSSTTTNLQGFVSILNTAAAAYTVTDLRYFRVAEGTKGAGSTITNQTGLYIGDLTNGTNNYGINSLVSSGTNKWNIYASGTAQNYFAGNVGIGTSSPASKLTVAGGYVTLTGTSNNHNIAQGTGWIWTSDGTASGTIRGGIFASTDGSTSLFGGSSVVTTQFKLDSSGNLGLGVTPKTWESILRAEQFGYSGSIVGGTAANNVSLNNNWYSTAAGVDTRINDGYATRYTQNASGYHGWYVSGTSTAGTSISFTQAMTLDASGNLALGQTSANGSRLNIFGGTLPTTGNGLAFASGLTAGRFSTGDNIAYIGQFGDGTTTEIGAGTSASYNSSIALAARSATSNPGTIRFATYGTERARIDSSGNLLVGTTTASGKVSVVSTANETKLWVQGHGTGQGRGAVFRNGVDSADAIVFRNASDTQVGSINVSATATTYNTSSDYRLKNTIAPMTGALAKVAALKPVTYKWNADGSDGEGFIAHELAEVVTQCVTGEKDAVDADGNPVYQGIDTSFLVATLTAAIQEQQAIINDLKARLDAANL